MTIARAQMNRQLYQMGGEGIMQLGNGQEEPIFPRLETLSQNLGQAEQTLGAPSNDQFNMSSITTAFTGRPQMNLGGRMNYQEGGMEMMQPQMQQAPEGIMSMMPQEASGGQQGLSEEKGKMSLAVIIKLLMEQGIDPETAKELAMQILQAFAQGGEAGVEEFANQLEQEEMGAQQFAQGGIVEYAYRKKYGWGSPFKAAAKVVKGAVKGVASAVKSVAKSQIGKIALTAAAVYFGGPMLASSFGISGAAGAAWAGGLANSALQIASGQKFNPLEALISAGGAYVSAGGLSSGTQGTINAGGAGIPGSDIATTSTLNSGVTQSLPTSSFPDLTGQVAPGSMVYNAPTTAAGTYPSLGFEASPTSSVVNVGATQPNIFERGITSLQEAGTNLMNDPFGTIGKYATSAYDTVKENALPLAAGFLAGSSLAQQPNESDDEYASRAARDANVAAYITQYGRGAKIYSPGDYGLYAREKAIDPFAGRSTYAAMGGRIGYGLGNLVKSSGVAEPVSGGDTSGGGGFNMGLIGRLIQQNPEMFRAVQMASRKDFIDQNQNGIDDRQEASYGGRMGYALGAEVPTRENQAGVTELDYRKKGGFVPPIGIKEKADDIPAMLSNNEFVFTANAVRNAGGGNVNKGAQRMYGLMKQLEAGGVV
jgi:hypothetical protein